jgi:hypothetical protein
MPELAQTNVQLIREVIGAGWSDDELVRLRRAYELAMWAYSGQYRGDGRTQIAHHVGTASALVSTGERPALATAGLVHSLYFFGEFGSGRRGADPAKRARVERALGPEIEQLLDAYPQIKWSAASVARMTATAHDAPPIERDLVALRVANAVDEFAVYALRLAPRRHLPGDLVGGEAVEAIAALGEAHGLDLLAGLLRDAYARGVATPLPAVLVTPSERTVFVPPASHRRRIHIALQDNPIVHAVTEAVPAARRVGVWVRRRIA